MPGQTWITPVTVRVLKYGMSVDRKLIAGAWQTLAITTAGSDGFLQLLPVYVDHILYPTLTNEGFYTEVHHIDQDGQDAGIV